MIWAGLKRFLSWIDTYSKTIQALLTSAAIIIGGIWTYNAFVKERPYQARLNITQSAAALKLPGDQQWLEVTINFKNIGKTRIEIGGGFIRIQRVIPLDEELFNILSGNTEDKLRDITERRFVKWPVVCSRKLAIEVSLEPDEKLSITHDFFVPKVFKVLRVYTYVTDKSGGDSHGGWSNSIIYNTSIEPEDSSNEILRSGDGARVVCRDDE